MHGTTVREVEAAMSWDAQRGDVECEACDRDIPTGEVVIIDGMLCCCPCAYGRATDKLSELLHPEWSPPISSMEEYRQAWAVVAILQARIARRIKEG